MGVVFEAEHLELRCRVAIKLLQQTRALDGVGVQRFLREARAAAQTKHLHAVSVIDVGAHEEQWFIVMELLEGETLAALIAREAPLPKQRVAELLLPVIAGVSAAHEAGVIHRDLKPANIVLARRGRRIVHPVVTDFGISKLLVDTTTDSMTSSHALLGTLHYMAPELTRAADRATPLSDQYSLGVMLYECATGRRPFKAESPYELMHAIVTGVFPRPRDLNSAMDANLEAVVLRAMDREPTRRYPSLQALGSALLTCADQRTWAIWAPELAADSTLPHTTRDDSDVLDLTPTGFQVAPDARQPRSLRRAGYVVAAGIIVGCLVWLLVGEAHQGRAHALAASQTSTPDRHAALDKDRRRGSTDPSSSGSASERPPPVCAGIGSATATTESPPRARDPEHRIARGPRMTRRPPVPPTPRVSRTLPTDSSNVTPVQGGRPLAEFGTNNAPILD